jgi:hypothetical protein
LAVLGESLADQGKKKGALDGLAALSKEKKR